MNINWKSALLSLLKNVFIILFSQIFSVLLTTTGIFSTNIQKKVHIPLFQATFLYLSLTVIYLPLWIIIKVKNTVSKLKNQNGSEKITLRNLMPVHFSSLIMSFFQAFFDVHGNLLLVMSYQYTTIETIQLLDCFTVPVVMFLSLTVLRVRFRCGHYLGVFLCLSGIVLLMFSDLIINGDFQHGWFGDFLTLLGATSYAFANVLEESIMKHKEKVNQWIDSKLAWIYNRVRILLKRNKMDTENVGAYDEDDAQSLASFKTNTSRKNQKTSASDSMFKRKDTVVEVDLDNVSEHWDEDSESSSESKMKIIENIFEFLAFLGVFGLIINTIEVFIFEFNSIKTLSDLDVNVILNILGFNIVMFLLYSLVPIFLTLFSAMLYNLSILTSDFLAVIVTIVFFNKFVSIYIFNLHTFIL